MRSRLQLDVCNLSLGRRHLVNAKEGISVIAGRPVWSMPEGLRGFTTRRYVNTLYLTSLVKYIRAYHLYTTMNADCHLNLSCLAIHRYIFVPLLSDKKLSGHSEVWKRCFSCYFTQHCSWNILCRFELCTCSLWRTYSFTLLICKFLSV